MNPSAVLTIHMKEKKVSLRVAWISKINFAIYRSLANKNQRDKRIISKLTPIWMTLCNNSSTLTMRPRQPRSLFRKNHHLHVICLIPYSKNLIMNQIVNKLVYLFSRTFVLKLPTQCLHYQGESLVREQLEIYLCF